MTTCRTLDCIHNGREKEKQGSCTLDETKREVDKRGFCTSYKTDHPWLQSTLGES